MNSRLLVQTLSAILVVLFWVKPGMSQSTDRWEVKAGFTSEELSVFPAQIGPNSLGYALYDSSAPKGSHNAATYYYRAALKWASLPKPHRQKLFKNREIWLEGEIGDFPHEEVEQWLAETDTVFVDLDKALTGTCEWGLEGDGATLSDLRSITHSIEFIVFQEFGDMLQLSARLHLCRSEFDKAIERLADCITLSQDLSLIHI